MRALLAFLPAVVLSASACSRPEPPPSAPPSTGPRVVAMPAASTPTASSAAAAVAEPATPSATPTPAVPPPGSPRPSAVEDANAATLRLFRAVAKPETNALIGPTSIRQALAIVYLGAKGVTATEMSKALSYPASLDEVAAEAFAETRDFEKARGPHELRIANRLFTDKRSTFLPDFTKRAEAGFGGSFENVDFAGAPDPARVKVNAWAEDHTMGKIKDLLPPGSVTQDTRLVVANAVWLKAPFLTPFDASRTAPAPFDGPRGKAAVPTMHVTTNLAYYDGKDAQIVELPYEKSTLALVVLLPKKPTGKDKGIVDLEKKLDEKWLAAQLGFAIRTRVELSLPKFAFGWSGELTQPLQSLGMKTVFTTKSDLSGLAQLSEGLPLAIQGVFHKTFIAVDEKGTEAAAATGVVVGVKSGVPGQPVTMTVDRPFLFGIRDTATGRVLFVGHLVEAPK